MLDVVLPLSLVARTVGVQERTSPVSPASLQLPDVAATRRVREHTTFLLSLENSNGKITPSTRGELALRQDRVGQGQIRLSIG